MQILWELPQFLLGIIIGLYYTNRDVSKVTKIGDVTIVKSKRMFGGISLGKIIVVSYYPTKHTIVHELGHSKQSKYLGPLYLIVIGIPSLIHSIIYTMFGGKWDYYKFYTEAWAEKLSKDISI